jgi:hypothetical protein
MKAPVERLVVADTAERIETVRAAESDLRMAGVITALEFVEAAEPQVTVELAPADAQA